MKKRLQGLIAGVLICTLLTGGVVFGKQLSETAELYYNNIKIFIDGAEIIPKDANGNQTEPFTMNGTTYLPVRAISNAFGKAVDWDGETQSVYIGKKDHTKPDNYLDKIQYNDYKKANSNNFMRIINGTVTDFNSNVYTNGILFGNGKKIQDDKDEAGTIICYPLNSQYSNLKGKIVLPKQYDITTGKSNECDVRDSHVIFYGDNKLIYKATNVTSSMPFNFDIDVRGVNQLTVKISTPYSNWSDWTEIALTDLALYK